MKTQTQEALNSSLNTQQRLESHNRQKQATPSPPPHPWKLARLSKHSLQVCLQPSQIHGQ